MQCDAIHDITKIKTIFKCNVFRPNGIGSATWWTFRIFFSVREQGKGRRLSRWPRVHLLLKVEGGGVGGGGGWGHRRREDVCGGGGGG